jgi:site-specific recombinase XerD
MCSFNQLILNQKTKKPKNIIKIHRFFSPNVNVALRENKRLVDDNHNNEHQISQKKPNYTTSQLPDTPKDINNQRPLEPSINLSNQETKEHIKADIEDSIEDKMSHITHQPIDVRGYIEYEEFLEILNFITISTYSIYVKARQTIALIVLYSTGLQLTTLLTMTVYNFMNLYEKQETILYKKVRKKRSDKKQPDLENIASNKIQVTLENVESTEIQLVVISKQSQNLLKQYESDIKLLIKNKNPQHFLFTNSKNFSRAVSRELMDRQLNAILKKASEEFNKYIRLHSLRISVIKRCFQEQIPVEQIKQLLQYHDIRSIENFRKILPNSDLQDKNFVEIMNSMDKQYC